MDEGVLLLVVGAILAASIFAALAANRTGVPVLVAFLALGMLLGSDGPGGIDNAMAIGLLRPHGRFRPGDGLRPTPHAGR